MKEWKEFDEGFDPENPNPGPSYWAAAFWTIVTMCVFGAFLGYLN